MVDVWHPFTQLRGFEPVGRVVGAKGAWIELEDGRRLLDGIASWWVNLHGHAHPRIVDAIQRQVAAFDQVILADFTHGPAAELTRRLAEVLPGDVDHVHYSDDGSTAVEVALKMAWQAQRQLGQGHRRRLVAFEGAYHGDTLGCMRMGDRSAYSAPFDDLLGPVDRLPWDDADAVEAFFAEHGHEVALVLIEPMLQGAGGMRTCTPDFLRRLAAAAQGAGALLICDEVATGFGRTGRLWASEHAGIVPDVMCLSKGITGGALALGATACTRRVFEAFLGPDKRTSFLHGHSYAGNPIACAAALASLDVLQEDDTPGRYARLEALWREEAPALAAIPGVSGVRCLGGVLAFDVVGGGGGYHDPIGRRVQRAAVAEGLYVRPMGDVVYLLPPACVTDDEARWAVGVLGRAVRSALEAG